MNRFAAHRARLKAQGDLRRDQLAELVANGDSIAAASAKIGISQQRGSQLFAEIRRKLGPQAQ